MIHLSTRSILRPIAAGIACTALFATSAKAQIVTTGPATEVFMQGTYIEVGVATNGSFGTDNDCPAAYHGRSPFGATGAALGFVADPDKDGWTVGTPGYFGDYYLPGTPQEGWDMLIEGREYRAWRADPVGWGGTTFVGANFTGTNVTYSSTPTKVESVWKGKIDDLNITQTTTLKTDKVYFIIKVKLNNDGDTTLHNIYYERTLDPDNDILVGGTYSTDNKIIYNLPDADNRTLVTALGDRYASFLGLGSKDCRVRPYILNGGLSRGAGIQLDQIYNDNGTGTTGYIFKKDSLYSNDVGIGIVFKLDSIKAHDSTILSYAYVLRAEDLDSAFQDLEPLVQYNGKNYISGDTILVCKGTGPTTAQIDLVNASDFHWSWSPHEGLSDSVGTSITVTLNDDNVKVYYATPTAFGCPMDPIKVVIKPVKIPAAPAAPSPIYYCQFDAAVPLTATATGGAVLLYYTSEVGGTPVASITPKTTTVGTVTYYVSQKNSICESERTPINVITRALPIIANHTSTDPTRCAAADGTISFDTDGPGQVYTVHFDYNGTSATPLVLTADAAGQILIAGLRAGEYSNLYVVNQYGCKSNVVYGPIVLTGPVPPGPPISNNGPVCLGGTVHLYAPTVDSVTYSWSGPGGFASNDISPTFIMTEAGAGVYTLILRKGECEYTPSTTNLVLAYTPKKQAYAPVTLCEQTKLEVPVKMEAGVHYTWSGNGISGIYDQNLIINPIATEQAGAYVLTSNSESGCITYDTVQVNVDHNISVVVSNDTSICSNGAAQLVATTDAPAVSWTPADGLSSANVPNPSASPAATTLYTVTALSQSTCADKTGTVTVTIVPAPSVQGFDTIVRMNVPFTIVPTYGPDAVQWQWVPSDSLSCSNCPNPVFSGNKNMDYLVYTSNAMGCISSDTVRIHVFCDGASVTMPNAFTPNGDGHNDKYYVRGHGFVVRKFAIYNRLGQEIFAKENFAPNDDQYGWDGTYQNTKITNTDGFVYMLEVQCYNSGNEPITLKGTFLLIR